MKKKVLIVVGIFLVLVANIALAQFSQSQASIEDEAPPEELPSWQKIDDMYPCPGGGQDVCGTGRQ